MRPEGPDGAAGRLRSYGTRVGVVSSGAVDVPPDGVIAIDGVVSIVPPAGVAGALDVDVVSVVVVSRF